ncbi:MAG: hypothetical protein GY830_06430 [Bacteroidetes bacterium]|nr:hypothetical protein [Bacteroidota bacterium]
MIYLKKINDIDDPLNLYPKIGLAIKVKITFLLRENPYFKYLLNSEDKRFYEIIMDNAQRVDLDNFYYIYEKELLKLKFIRITKDFRKSKFFRVLSPFLLFYCEEEDKNKNEKIVFGYLRKFVEDKFIIDIVNMIYAFYNIQNNCLSLKEIKKMMKMGKMLCQYIRE